MDLPLFNLPTANQSLVSLLAHDAASLAARLNAQFLALATVPPPPGELAYVRGLRLGAASDGGKWSVLFAWDFDSTAQPPVEGEINPATAVAVAVEGDGSSDTEIVATPVFTTTTGQTLGAALVRALNAAAAPFVADGEACVVRDVQDAGCNAGGRFVLLAIFEHFPAP